MKEITSLQNELIKHLVTLHTPKGIRQAKEFIAHGHRTIQTLLQAGLKPLLLCATHEHYAIAEQLAANAPVYLVTQAIAKKITPSTTASGIVALFPIPAPPVTLHPLQALALVDIQDPGNMGTLIRTAIAMNIKDIFVVGGCEPWQPKVVQSTAGNIGFARIIQLTWDQLIQLPERSPLCAMVVRDGLSPAQLPSHKVVLVVGNEAKGLTPQQITACDYKLTLPMPGQTESLNAAIAGAIGMYLLAQQ